LIELVFHAPSWRDHPRAPMTSQQFSFPRI
jgi:hypothetical protein